MSMSITNLTLDTSSVAQAAYNTLVAMINDDSATVQVSTTETNAVVATVTDTTDTRTLDSLCTAAVGSACSGGGTCTCSWSLSRRKLHDASHNSRALQSGDVTLTVATTVAGTSSTSTASSTSIADALTASIGAHAGTTVISSTRMALSATGTVVRTGTLARSYNHTADSLADTAGLSTALAGSLGLPASSISVTAVAVFPPNPPPSIPPPDSPPTPPPPSFPPPPPWPPLAPGARLKTQIYFALEPAGSRRSLGAANTKQGTQEVQYRARSLTDSAALASHVEMKVVELLVSNGILAGAVGVTVTVTSQVQVTVDGGCSSVSSVASIIDQLVASVNTYSGQTFAPTQLPTCQYLVVAAPSQPPLSPPSSMPPPQPIAPPPWTPLLSTDSKTLFGIPLIISLVVVVAALCGCGGYVLWQRQLMRVAKIDPVSSRSKRSDASTPTWWDKMRRIPGRWVRRAASNLSAEQTRVRPESEESASSHAGGLGGLSLASDATRSNSSAEQSFVMPEEAASSYAGALGSLAPCDIPIPSRPASSGGSILSMPTSPPAQYSRPVSPEAAAKAHRLMVESLGPQLVRQKLILETAAQQSIEMPDEINADAGESDVLDDIPSDLNEGMHAQAVADDTGDGSVSRSVSPSVDGALTEVQPIERPVESASSIVEQSARMRGLASRPGSSSGSILSIPTFSPAPPTSETAETTAHDLLEESLESHVVQQREMARQRETARQQRILEAAAEQSIEVPDEVSLE